MVVTEQAGWQRRRQVEAKIEQVLVLEARCLPGEHFLAVEGPYANPSPVLGAALSFLGLGAQPPTAELGSMAAEGRRYLSFAPHVSTLPSAAIFSIVLAFNVLGDALRDVLDPRLRQ